VTCFIDHVIQINEGVWTLKKETEELSRVEWHILLTIWFESMRNSRHLAVSSKK
jgi:hypothetical protein